MTHILILGSNGQLGRALQAVFALQPDTRVTIGDLPDFDITKPATADQVAELAPDVVINAAAWTNVDAAEENAELVFAVNSLGPHNLAIGCARCDALLVQISTNEVFPGLPGRFYFEYDQPGPSGIYARSKLAGEIAVRTTWRRSMVVRVAWMFGPGGNNFPSKILAAAEKYGQLRVVDDEFGNPTYAPDAADGIARLIDHDRPGIYHLVNEGYTSRFEFAAEVLRQNGCEVPMTPVHADEWKRASTPPPHAVVVNQTAAALGVRQRPWQEALANYVHAQKALDSGSA